MNLPPESVANFLRQKWVLAADEDYITARLCDEAFLGRQFAWHAAQAIEKYVKCTLVLNGISIKKIGHASHLHLRKLASNVLELLPRDIDLAKTVKVSPSLASYAQEDFFDALKRFEDLGRPSSRYRETHLLVQPYDLQKLDFIVFCLRRISYPLAGDSNLVAKLLSNPLYTPNAGIDMSFKNRLGHARRDDAFRRENVAFFPQNMVTFKGTYKIQMEANPLEMAVETKLLSEEDKSWLNSMTKYAT